MPSTSVDERGRIYLPKELRQEYGTRYRIVRLHDGIKLIPLSKDALAGLREARAPLAGTDIRELRREAEDAAQEEALDDLR